MRLIAIATIFAAAMSASGAHAEDWSWLSFSKANALTAGRFKVEVDSTRRDGRPVWIAKRVEHPAVRGAPEQTTWADSDTCPAMMPAFATLQSIKPFTIMPPTLPDPKAPVEIPSVAVDGATFQIYAHGVWAKDQPLGEILLTGNYHTPVADWVEETMKALASCWGEQRPSA